VSLSLNAIPYQTGHPGKCLERRQAIDRMPLTGILLYEGHGDRRNPGRVRTSRTGIAESNRPVKPSCGYPRFYCVIESRYQNRPCMIQTFNGLSQKGGACSLPLTSSSNRKPDNFVCFPGNDDAAVKMTASFVVAPTIGNTKGIAFEDSRPQSIMEVRVVYHWAEKRFDFFREFQPIGVVIQCR